MACRNPRRQQTALILGALVSLSLTLIGGLSACTSPGTPKESSAPKPDSTTEQTSLIVVRRQVVYFPLASLHLPAAGGKIILGRPEGEATDWTLRQLFNAEPTTALRTGPAVEQLTGDPTHTMPGPVPFSPAKVTATASGIEASANDLSQLYLRWEVPALQPAGVVKIPVRWEYVPAGQRTMVQSSGVIELHVSDITLPAERAIHTVATTTMRRLAEIDPKNFGGMLGSSLDRGDAAQKDAIAAIDALITTAQRNGVVLTVEDLSPSVRVDEVGQILVDWEAYDRVVAPWMAGTAFADRLPLDVWVAPAPPKRIAESASQLRQYWLACLAHARQKGWTDNILLLHPALLDAQTTAEVANRLAGVIRKDVDAAVSVAVMRRLDEAEPAKLLGERLRMWVVDDEDTFLPPGGALATAESIRTWPWMCHARGLTGMLWRDAVRQAGTDPRQEPPLFALAADGAVLPTARLAWLTTGIADAERFALLKKRSDLLLANEVLAGVVGRTGSTAAWSPQQQPNGLNAFAPATRHAGYLYDGWSADPATWASLPSMLDALILQYAPGQQAKPAHDDPQVLAAKMWLAQAHRPIARVGAYQFDVAPGKDGAVVTMDVQVGLENPIGMETQMSPAWPHLPGDLKMVANPANPRQTAPTAYTVLANERRWAIVRAEGHMGSFVEQPAPAIMEWTEHSGGTQVNLPVAIPVYAMAQTDAKMVIDGKSDDWVSDPRYATYPLMRAETRYANRPDLQAERISTLPADAAQKSAVRWTFDNEFVYAFIDLAQPHLEDQKSSQWPLAENAAGLRRWWGADGVEVLIAGGSRLGEGSRVAQVAIKPGGAVLSRMGTVSGSKVDWVETTQGLRYAIVTRADGYAVELAMPRKWFEDASKDPDRRVWRVNVLRHFATDYPSTSWSGPVVDDVDIGMMGLLIGEK